jgi:hypothetical protein
MKNISYENKILRNTNYYLLCTLYNLEKYKTKHLNSIIVVSEEPETHKNDLELENEDESFQNINDTNNNDLIKKMEEKQREYEQLNTELNDLKIKMEIQKEFSEHKIQNLELAKQFLEQELLEKQNIITNHNEYTNKDVEEDIEKLKKDNEILTINNQQLQFELIRSIKQL